MKIHRNIVPLLLVVWVASYAQTLVPARPTQGAQSVPTSTVNPVPSSRANLNESNSNSSVSSIKLSKTVGKTIPQTVEDVKRVYPIDLKTPDNIKTTAVYDPLTGFYALETRLGEDLIATPILLTQEEYLSYLDKQSAAAYWKNKNKIDFTKKGTEFSLTNLQFDLGLGDKIFGEGGVQLRTQGSVETKFGLKTNKVDNPSLAERSRNRTQFDFDQNIQMRVNGKVGDKIDVNLNYDTEATFDYDTKSIKLRYDGKEDEIIKSLQAGNVSMPINNSLITGGASLFGLKSEFQFGKLNLAAVVSQQKGQTSSVSLNGGVQTTSFEITPDQYDENRHYFLSQYFRNHYDEWISGLPYISSGIVVKKVEVWVTNKKSDMSNARNIVAFADMGESTTIYNAHWTNSTNLMPSNASNNLYNELIQNYAQARSFSQISSTFAPLESDGVHLGTDYERLENARRLSSSEFVLNASLGYISLKQTLSSDEILSVAYEYTYNGRNYKVGEFSTDGIEAPSTLFVKLIKGTVYAPGTPTWKLMMRNIYSLNEYDLKSENFQLDILYRSDSVGANLNYITEGNIKNQLLLRVMGLDRLNSRGQTYPDGVFDFVPGYTVLTENGCIIFPVLEPFGSNLRTKIGNNVLANKYVFEELYDSTLTAAQQLSEKNKFLMRGTYKASSGSTIDLGTRMVSQGSVKVTAGGRELVENSDYTVDYSNGTVTILNQALIQSGTPINATCEGNSSYNMVRKTMLGVTANYAFSDNFNFGGTLMRLSETPLTNKVDMGFESVNNTIWGLNTSFKTQSQFLTNLIDKIPFIDVTKPSQLTLKGEIAQLIAGSSKALNNMSYLDDFESAKKTIYLKDVTQWSLASTPYDPSGGLFPEAAFSNDLRYGYNRSLLAWYYVDNMFTQLGTSQTPSHIRSDYNQLSNHFVRLVQEKEVFPGRQTIYGQNGLLNVMNLAFYPKERGPYNFDADGLDSDGTLLNPEKRWGGIMRKIESNYTNFESNNVEYIEFWLMDPFVYDTAHVATGGDLYFNLGEISEDVLKDGKRSFENGLPTSSLDLNLISATAWGKVSGKTSTIYAFDNTAGVRDAQDVGLDGLSNLEEAAWPGISEYVQKVKNKITPATEARMLQDRFSPLNDPSGDNYHYYRGSDYDAKKASILERYKHYNGTEGNSQSPGKAGETYSTARSTTPDVEDINGDFTLNESERYYQYRVSLRPSDMVVGENFINDIRTANVALKNGKSATINWYQFKVPIKEYQKKVGSINGFNSIRFMRMFLTGFQDSIILRMASLDLVQGDWRSYTKDLYSTIPTSDAKIDISTISLEENSSRSPINYVLPPGVSQETNPSQPGVFLEDEQSLVVRVTDLSPGDARAVYKNTSFDFRQYERLQMFVHAEALLNDLNPPRDKDISIFIRIGSDNQNNYYEYEIPLVLSPPYVNSRTSVWPLNNFFDVAFLKWTNLKTKRNVTGGSMVSEFSAYDEEHPENKIKILGNPSLSEVKTIMVGVRNKGNTIKSVEIWLNELRLKGFHEEGGWAATGSATLALSDLGTINASGKFVSDGFGGLEQSVNQRSIENRGQYNLSMNFNMGKIFPEKAKVSLPIYYSISNEQGTPKYDPLNEDLLLNDELRAVHNKKMRDSILNYSQDVKTFKSISLNNVRIGIRSAVPLPIDPANFSFRYSNTQSSEHNSTTEYALTKRYDGGISYTYDSPLPLWKPFSKVDEIKKPKLSKWKDFSVGFLPNSLTANTNLLRDYFERQSRDLASSAGGMNLPLTVSKSFFWNSDLALNWNLTKNLRMNFNINNKSIVEETNTSPVNKNLYATEYQNWKDTVTRSLKEFGTPILYTQTFKMNWQLPTNLIPILDFLNNTVADYTVNYNWNKSAISQTQTNVGNTISNRRNMTFNSTINFLTLYNKWDFLATINKKFDAPPKVVNPSAPAIASMSPADPVILNARKFEEKRMFDKDSVIVVRHTLNNKRVYALVVDSAGKSVPIEYTVTGPLSVNIKSSKKGNFKVSILQKTPLEQQSWYAPVSLSARLLMSVRSVTIAYSQENEMLVPGFRPESSLFANSPGYGTAPGWDFAMGLQTDHYLSKALHRGWLINNDSINSPASLSNTNDLRIKSSLEIVRGLKVELNSSRTMNSRNQIQYMFEGMPQNKTGSFNMTTLLMASSFESSNSKNGYNSAVFNQFLENRSIVQSRLEHKMQNQQYPNSGFLTNSALASSVFDPANGTFSENSGDVLIPAFLAAYTKKDASKASLDIFPSLRALVPNWALSFDGLSNIGLVKKYFKNVTLKHGYASTYNVSSFSSYNSWVGAGAGLGYVEDVVTGNPIPSSIYDVGSVTLMEKYAPLIGIQATMMNGLTLTTEMSTTRSMTLSVSGGQVVQANQSEFSLGSNYKIDDFHPWGFLMNSKVKNDLNLTGNLRYKNTFALLRKIKDTYTQASSGNKTFSFELKGEYGLSRNLNVSMYYDLESSIPLVSSYPVRSSDFGFSMRFSLNR